MVQPTGFHEGEDGTWLRGPIPRRPLLRADLVDARVPRRPPPGAPILVLARYLVGLWWRRSRWHWRSVRDTGVHLYQENGRGDRRVCRIRGGHQPIAREWLAGGEFRDVRRPPE